MRKKHDVVVVQAEDTTSGVPVEQGVKITRGVSEGTHIARTRDKSRREEIEEAVARGRAIGLAHKDIAERVGITERASRGIVQRPAVKSMIAELSRANSERINRSYDNLLTHIDEALDPNTTDITRRERMEAGDRLIRALDATDRAEARLAEMERERGVLEGGHLLTDLLVLMRQVRQGGEEPED